MKTVNKNAVCNKFISEIEKTEKYIRRCTEVFSDDDLYLSYSYENAILMIYKSFEEFMIRIMVSCLNHDHSAFEEKHGIALGRHINDDVCEFLITKGGYFDFRGYSGLLDMLKGTIGNDHTFVSTIKKERYKTCINKMCAARNYAAHNSKQSKNAVKKVFNAQSISSAGSFLKSARRMADIIESLKALADEVKAIDLY